MAVTVHDVPPTLTISGPSSIAEGSTDTLNLANYNPAQDTIASWAINWGDGIVQSVAGNPSSVTHVYSSPLQSSISATATDQNGTYNSNSIPITVLDVAPAVVPAGKQTVLVGTTLALYAGSFTDPGFENPVTGVEQEFSGTINWGDGTSAAGVTTVTYGAAGVLTTGNVWGSHNYALAGVYTVTVTVSDGDGGVTIGTFSVTVDPSATEGLGCFPTTTTITGISNDTNGSTSSGATTADPRLVLAGMSAPDTIVTISRDNVPVGSTTSDANGNWAFDYTGTTLANNTYNFTASAAPLGPLGVAGQFNAFIFQNDSEQKTDAQGRLAIGGNATFSNYTVGSNIANSNGTRDDLIVGGTLDAVSGSIPSGNIVYGASNSTVSGSFTLGTGDTARQDSVINFSAVQTYLTNVSADWYSLPANGTVTNSSGTVTFTGTDPAFNVFQVAGSVINGANTVNISVVVPEKSIRPQEENG